MPYEIRGASFDTKLNIRVSNVSQTLRFLECGVETFRFQDWLTPSGYALRVSKRADQYRLIHVETKETVYAVKLRFRTDIVAGRKTCTQVLVWRTNEPLHEHAVNGLAQRFFNFFIAQYNIVVTDEQQTPDGRNFWARRVAWSLRFGHYVYISNGGEEDRPLTRVKDYDDFYPHWADFCWGKDPEVHTHRLVVISTEELL